MNFVPYLPLLTTVDTVYLRYLDSQKSLKKSSITTYRLDLQVEYEHVHNVFHILRLQKYVPT